MKNSLYRFGGVDVVDDFYVGNHADLTVLDLNIYGLKLRIKSDNKYITEYKKYYSDFITCNSDVDTTFYFTVYENLDNSNAVSFRGSELAFEKWPAIFCIQPNHVTYYFLIPELLYPAVLMSQIVNVITSEKYAGLGIIPIHAGAVSKDDKAILFIGEKRAGKTTLSLSMAKYGYKYFTDDITLIDIASNKILPFYRGITPRKQTVDMYPELIQNNYSHQYIDSDDGETRWCVELNKHFENMLSPISNLRYIVFPQYNAEKEFSWTIPDKNKTILLLMKNMKLVPTKVMGSQAIPTLNKILDNIEVYCISYPNSAKVVEFVSNLYRGERHGQHK